MANRLILSSQSSILVSYVILRLIVVGLNDNEPMAAYQEGSSASDENETTWMRDADAICVHRQ